MPKTRTYKDHLIIDFTDNWLDCYYTGLIIHAYIFQRKPTTYLYTNGSYFRLSQEYMTQDGYTAI